MAINLSFAIGHSLRCVGQTITCSAMAALPIFGLILFFEITRPATSVGGGLLATHFSLNAKPPVARFEGVSARVSDENPGVKMVSLSAREAGRVLADANAWDLRVGLEVQFVSEGGRKLVLRITGREALGDRTLPERGRTTMPVLRASTSNANYFNWGQWRYRFEVEEVADEQPLAVQKSL